MSGETFKPLISVCDVADLLTLVIFLMENYSIYTYYVKKCSNTQYQFIKTSEISLLGAKLILKKKNSRNDVDLSSFKKIK